MKACNWIQRCLLVACCLLPLLASGQVTLLVTELPDQPGSPSSLYLTGNFNEWDPGDARYRMDRDPEGRFSITLKEYPDTLRFKITRGNWETVEGNAFGLRRPERVLVPGPQGMTVPLKVESWEDAPTQDKIALYVESVPRNTPRNTSLFVAGDFNDWDPGDPNYELDKLPDGRWYIEMPFLLDTIRYKITRGNWESVEANAMGKLRTNRQFVLAQSESRVIRVKIDGWEDQVPPHHFQITITKKPSNTPQDASMYLTGNFNNWTTNDENVRFERQDNGHYTVDVFATLDTLVYKVTRGTWESVECRANGRIRANRTLRAADGPETYEDIQIAAWEDLSGGWFNLYTLSLMMPLGIGLMLWLGLASRGDSSWRQGPSVAPLLGVVCLGLLLRILPYYREIFNALPWSIGYPDGLYFLYPAVFYRYLRQLLGFSKLPRKLDLLLWVPSIIWLLLYSTVHRHSAEMFLIRVVNYENALGFGLVALSGFAWASFIGYASYRLLVGYRTQWASTQSKPVANGYLPTLFVIHSLVLVGWAVSLVLGAINQLPEAQLTLWQEGVTNATWIFFAAIIYGIGYHALRTPDVTREKAPLAPEAEVKESAALSGEELEQLRQRLNGVMSEQQPYLNPGLTLQQLAEAAQMPASMLSRVINESLGKNFYDYVNEFRVREFVQRVNRGEDKNLTFLALALAVGFSSKSTFNRAFKKVTETTPREFFRHTPEEQHRMLGLVS